MRHVVAAIGETAAQAIEAKLGGKRIVIPKTIGLNHPIGQAVGTEVAAKLSAEFAGAILDVPVGAKKRALIEGDLRKGDSVNTVAARYFTSPRTIWRIKAALADDEPQQLGLF
ncbi:hypothetical protein ABI_08800 [Asticcacaulis biprosthecium C19]|uniref:Mor transcription activator family protein n=2 Tax=Asticcacaulis biprosthecium TaxID=76891 RepID=F4QGB6_9CAUL|nr:hypothetical protein ABI_08800 [Asticcacaulis biprosthecium C19]